MPTITKNQYICLCVAEGSDQSWRKRGEVVVADMDYGALYTIDDHVKSGGKNPAFILIKRKEMVFEYDMPTAEAVAEITLPIMEAGLQKLRADFVVAETRLLADIASIRQLTYKGPIEGDYVAAADSAKDVTPMDLDAEDAEIVDR